MHTKMKCGSTLKRYQRVKSKTTFPKMCNNITKCLICRHKFPQYFNYVTFVFSLSVARLSHGKKSVAVSLNSQMLRHRVKHMSQKQTFPQSQILDCFDSVCFQSLKFKWPNYYWGWWIVNWTLAEVITASVSHKIWNILEPESGSVLASCAAE